VYTVGYEGRTPAGLVAELVGRGVDVLVDVRELPLSRRKGFSKTALRSVLSERGIRYVHMRELGSPREVRHRLKEDGDYGAFFKAYRAHLAGRSAVLSELATLVSQGVCCLMCYERESDRCHRSVVAERVQATACSELALVDI